MNADSSRDERLFEVIADWLDCPDASRPPREALYAEHPDLAAELKEFFERHDAMKRSAWQSGAFVGAPLLHSANASPHPQAAGVHARDGIDEPTLAPSVNTASGSRSAACPTEDTLRLFGEYELVREIARGGMGVVYLARQRKLNRVVALKMILAGQLASAEDVRRFYAEAEAAATLDHPGIVPIHDVGQFEGQHFFSMGYVDGRSLSDLVAAGPIEPLAAAELVRKIALAVQYAHSRGVIHRDLKPANILLDAAGEPKVTDFGLAKRAGGEGGLTASGQILGTPGYMSPEQASGRIRDVGPLSDVYGLGAILYALLTGRAPFSSDNPIDTLLQVLESEPTLPTKFNRRAPRSLELICLRCLEKQPEQRYSSAQDLADDLHRYLRGDPVEARAARLWPRVRRWARREPALASHWAALALMAVVVQLVFMGFGSDVPHHLRNMGVLAVWAAASFVLQLGLNSPRLEHAARFAWALADSLLLTTLIYLADAPRGPLLIGYPLLIAASGLFFRVRLVAAMTGLTLAAYAVLMYLKPEEAQPIYYCLVFAAALAVVGFLVGYQTHRMRALSQYYDPGRPA